MNDFNPGTQEAEADGAPSLRPARSVELVLCQKGLYSETLDFVFCFLKTSLSFTLLYFF